MLVKNMLWNFIWRWSWMRNSWPSRSEEDLIAWLKTPFLTNYIFERWPFSYRIFVDHIQGIHEPNAVEPELDNSIGYFLHWLSVQSVEDKTLKLESIPIDAGQFDSLPTKIMQLFINKFQQNYNYNWYPLWVSYYHFSILLFGREWKFGKLNILKWKFLYPFVHFNW